MISQSWGAQPPAASAVVDVWVRSTCADIAMTSQATTTIEAASIPTGENSSKRKYNWQGDDGRKRVSQACDQCRIRKLKCDGVRPTCISCSSLSRECTYGTAVKKRGLPEGYVRGLEKLLALVMLDHHDQEQIVRLFERASNNDVVKKELVKRWNGTVKESGETLPEVWRNSRLSKILEQLLPDLDAPCGQEIKKPRLDPHSIDSAKGESAISSSFLEQLPPPGTAEELFNVYFQYTHCWFPIIGKDEMLAAYYRSLELSEPSLGSGDYASLWAVLAYVESQRLSPSSEILEEGHINQSYPRDLYYERARNLIPREDAKFQIGHVQALLLLSLLKVRLGQLSPAWLLVGQAVNMTIVMGLRGSSKEQSFHSNGRFKHILLGCFCIDTAISAGLGRRPRVIERDILAAGLLEEHGLEEWGHSTFGERSGPTRSLSTFNVLTRLSKVLNVITSNGFSVHPEQKHQKIQILLNDWKTNVPSYCSIAIDPNDANQLESISPHQLNLFLLFKICVLLSQPQYNSPSGLENCQEDVREMRKIMQRLGPSEFRTAIFPPTFYLLEGLLQGLRNPSQEPGLRKASRTTNSTVREDSASKFGNSDLLSNRESFSQAVELISVGGIRELGNYSDMVANLDPQDNRASSSIEPMIPSSCRNWSCEALSPGFGVSIAPEGVKPSHFDNLDGPSVWCSNTHSAYSGAGQLFPGALTRTVQVPLADPIEVDGLQTEQAGTVEEPFDPTLQPMIGADDLFFEMSNLDNL